MKNLTFEQMAAACHGTLCNYRKEEDREVSGVVLDSRKVEENVLFIATKGARVDGHDFVLSVMEKGAAGAVCERPVEGMRGPYILVKDSFQALKDIAEYYRRQLPVKVVGVTGSVGKTSTKEMIASVLATSFDVLKTEGNYNNETGLPLTVLRLRDHHEVAVLEMGISDFGEMRRLSKIARPDICVLTNIGQCHLENLKSRDGILKAKTEIFESMNPEGTVCVNGDDDRLFSIRQVRGKAPVRFGLNKSFPVYAQEIVNHGLFGSSARLHVNGEAFDVSIPLPGEHMVYNALAAACVGELLGLTPPMIKKGIEAVAPVGGRSHILRLSQLLVIDDCYNANPVSMRAALELLATADTRKVAVLGDMFELGEDTEKLHEGVGAYAVEKGIDVIVCIGTLAKHMGQGALAARKAAGGSEETVLLFPGREEFVEKMPGLLKKGDTVLVKASHGMAFEEIVKALRSDYA